MMITIFRGTYMLLLSYNPCDVFDYFGVDSMHGLSKTECMAYHNTVDSAYIAGWCNFVPKESGEYGKDDKRYVFINLTRCKNDVATMGLIMHELMHQSFFLHDYNMDSEEDIITWAEEEAYEIFKIIKPYQNSMKQETLKKAAERFVNNTRLKNPKSLFCEGAKWQQERMYSEEEVEQIARFGFNAGRRVELKAVDLDFTFEKWFEQFKKK